MSDVQNLSAGLLSSKPSAHPATGKKRIDISKVICFTLIFLYGLILELLAFIAHEKTEFEGHKSSLGLASEPACSVTLLLDQTHYPDLWGWQPLKPRSVFAALKHCTFPPFFRRSGWSLFRAWLCLSMSVQYKQCNRSSGASVTQRQRLQIQAAPWVEAGAGLSMDRLEHKKEASGSSGQEL